tara:strand:+ start:647 stop:1054 length:408 start_codon:yes stop_codon:yes gene_type:complete
MPIITDTFIQKLKKQAKAECKVSSLSLTQIQDEIAREYGYLNWRTLITFKSRGAVRIDDAESWFRQKYSDSNNRSRVYIAIEEPNEIFEIIASEFDFGLGIHQGGRIAELAESLAMECSWICEEEIDRIAQGEAL